MSTTCGLKSPIALARRLLGPGAGSPRRAAGPARPTLASASLERRYLPSQVTILGPSYAVAQVSYGPQAPKLAWAAFGGVGTANLGAPESQQKANDGTNGVSTATFGYTQKPWQVVPGFNLRMDCTLGMARAGASAKAAIATRTSPTTGPAQALAVRIDPTGREVVGQAVTVSMRDVLTGGGSHLPATSAHVHYEVIYQGRAVRSFDGEVKQGQSFGTTFHARVGDTFQFLVDCRMSSAEYGTRGVGLALGVGAG